MGYVIDTEAHGSTRETYDGQWAFGLEDRKESFVLHRRAGDSSLSLGKDGPSRAALRDEQIEIEHRFLPALISALLEVLGRNADTVSVPYRLDYSGLQERLKAMAPPDPIATNYDELPVPRPLFRLILTDAITGEVSVRPEFFDSAELALDWVRNQFAKGEMAPSEFEVLQVAQRRDRKLPF